MSVLVTEVLMKLFIHSGIDEEVNDVPLTEDTHTHLTGSRDKGLIKYSTPANNIYHSAGINVCCSRLPACRGAALFQQASF